MVVFPEFAHAAPVFQTVQELLQTLTVPIPNEHTERLTVKAREHHLYIQSGSMLEEDPRWPGAVFNTTCFIGPDGILSKYRKVNTWIPSEVHSSPHDPPGYDEPLFPVVETPIGRLGCALCYDFDGRLLTNASPGPGERIVVAPIDVSALRHERQSRIGHHMLAHLRTEAYAVYRSPAYPPRSMPDMPLSYEENVRRIEGAKARTLHADHEIAPPVPERSKML